MKIPSKDVSNGYVSWYSPKESARFERKVCRYILAGDDSEPMIKEIESDAPDLAIIRIPTNRADLMPKFQQLCNDVRLGDCLVIYTRNNLKQDPPNPPRNKGFELREASIDDFELIDKMTEIIFNGYTNHYSSNPLLNDYNLVEAYKEWTRSFVTTQNQKCMVSNIEKGSCGYATIRIDVDESEGVLYGVLPEFRGRGIYRDLIRSTLALFIKENSPKTIVSTQIDNRAVQRVWVSEGFYLSHSYYTIHLNLLSE